MSPLAGTRIAEGSRSALWFAAALCLGAAVGVLAREEPKEVEVEGRLACLPELMHERHGAELPTGHAHVWGVTTPEGRTFLLLRTSLSEALFADERLRKRRLRLKGRVYPDTQILDVSRIRSVQDGKVMDLYYWCEICAIKSVVPGECMCCQLPVELVEKPLDAE